MKRGDEKTAQEREREEQERQEREEQAEEALKCPCLDKLKQGPCGKEFSTAFLCFLKSGHPDKGSDCVDPQFLDLQRCVVANHDAILSAQPADDPTRHKKETDLPDIPLDQIRLPPFMKKTDK